MSQKSSSKSTPMTQAALSRIHSAEAKAGGGQVKSDSFTARAQRTVAAAQQAPKGKSK
ncbi:MAG: hypothetical protein RSG22_17875 [Comamonas sp.]